MLEHQFAIAQQIAAAAGHPTRQYELLLQFVVGEDNEVSMDGICLDLGCMIEPEIVVSLSQCPIADDDKTLAARMVRYLRGDK